MQVSAKPSLKIQPQACVILKFDFVLPSGHLNGLFQI